MLAEIKDIDQIFVKWEECINLLATNMDKENIAQLNYDSVLAQLISEYKKDNVTLAKDMAKGDERIRESKGNLAEAERLVSAGKLKIKFLEERHNWLKKQIDINSRIAG